MNKQNVLWQPLELIHRPFVDQCQGSLGRLRNPYCEALRFSHL